MRKMCENGPWKHSQDQKGNGKNIRSDIMKQLTEEPDLLLTNVTTCDETGRIFQFDPKTKCQSKHWRTPSSPRMKKTRLSKLKLKTIIVFDDEEVVMIE